MKTSTRGIIILTYRKVMKQFITINLHALTQIRLGNIRRSSSGTSFIVFSNIACYHDSVCLYNDDLLRTTQTGGTES